MKKLFLVVASLVAMVGCTGDTSFPTPTGKGTVRALHAMDGAPDASFFVEERFDSSLSYKSASNGRRWDDFEYRFNFEVTFPGESEARRVSSTLLKVDANRDYTIVLSGAVTAPTVTLWEGDERTFDTADTVFEARFAHTAETLAAIDVYFAAPGTAPVLGEEIGTLSFGEILDPIDVEAGDYVLTITAADDPGDIIYQSDTAGFLAQNALIIPVFDGDESDVAPYTVRLLNGIAGLTALPDVRFSPTVRFFQASIDLPPSDVYDDEMLTNQVLMNHMFGDISGDIDVALGATTFTYTAVGNTSAEQFQGTLASVIGGHANFVVVGTEGSRVAIAYVPDRRSISNSARIRFLHAASNHDFMDLYVVDADEPIDDIARTLTLSFTLVSPSIALEAGSYDIYLTTFDEKTILDGPYRIDVVLGDTIEFVAFDRVDPALAEIRAVPAL